MWSHVGDRRDQKTLEKLRAERQSKIDELKERTNYYITQQLIQVQFIATCRTFLYHNNQNHITISKWAAADDIWICYMLFEVVIFRLVFGNFCLLESLYVN